MIDGRRLRRAIWLKIQPVSGGYLVSGGADDHIVEIDGGYVRCDCFDAQLNGDKCKHALCVRLHHGDSDVVKGLRALVAPPDGRSARRRTRPDRPEDLDSGTGSTDAPKTACEVPPETTFSGNRGDLAR